MEYRIKDGIALIHVQVKGEVLLFFKTWVTIKQTISYSEAKETIVQLKKIL